LGETETKSLVKLLKLGETSLPLRAKFETNKISKISEISETG